MVTSVSTSPFSGLMLEMAGAVGFTLKSVAEVSDLSSTLTMILPLVASSGTVTESSVVLASVTAAGLPLMLTSFLDLSVEKFLKVKVPAGLPLEPVWVRVSVQQQEATGATTFLLLPTIISYTPDHGQREAVVTLTGKNFDINAEVYFNGTKITYFPWDNLLLKSCLRCRAQPPQARSY